MLEQPVLELCHTFCRIAPGLLYQLAKAIRNIRPARMTIIPIPLMKHLQLPLAQGFLGTGTS